MINVSRKLPRATKVSMHDLYRESLRNDLMLLAASLARSYTVNHLLTLEDLPDPLRWVIHDIEGIPMPEGLDYRNVDVTHIPVILHNCKAYSEKLLSK